MLVKTSFIDFEHKSKEKNQNVYSYHKYMKGRFALFGFVRTSESAFFYKIGSIVARKYSVIVSGVSFILCVIHQLTASTNEDEI